MELKERILNKSRELFMRYGIKSVSMDDISRELGVSKKTLYQYVDNKTELIEQIFQLHIDDEKCMMNQIQGTARDAIDEILQMARFVMGELRQLSTATVYDLQKYYRETWRKMEALQKRFIYQMIRENIRKGIEEGLYRPEINADIIAKLYVAKSSLVADEELFPILEYHIKELFRQHIVYHIHGIAAPRGLEKLEEYLSEGPNEITG